MARDDERRGDELLDLPLGRDEPPGSEEPTAPLPVRGRGGGGRRWVGWALVAAALTVAGALAGYLLPLRGPAVIRFEPARVDFGTVRAGSQGEPLEIRVTNAGERRLEITALRIVGEGAGEFAIGPEGCGAQELPPQGSCSVAVSFRPEAGEEGPRGAALEIEGEAANSPVRVPLAGAVSAPRLEVRPVRLTFGERPAGTSSEPAPVRLRSAGGAPLRIRGLAVGGAGRGAFEVRGGACAGRELAPGTECALEVTFAPREAGEARAVLEIGSDSVPPPPPVALSGVGLPPEPVLSLGAEALEFPDIAVGSGGGRRTVSLENPGGAELLLERVGLEGPDAAAFEVAAAGCLDLRVEAGSGCSLEVIFRPQRPGPHQADLVVLPAGDLAPGAVALSGTGTAAGLRAEPGSLAFGPVRVGEVREAALTLTSSGNAPLTVPGARLAGPLAAAFRIAPGGCGVGGSAATLPPGSSCLLTVGFAPAAPGEIAARLELQHDGLSGPREVSLSGTALPPPAPELEVRPRTLRFGEEPVGGRSPILTLTLENPGTARLLFQGPVLTGPHAGDFRLVPGSCAGAPFLAPGGSCTVGLRFLPVAPGERRAEVVIRHDAAPGEARVELRGRGLVP